MTLDALPAKALNHLWPYLVENGDNLAVAAVCKSLGAADTAFLEKNVTELFETAQKTDTIIYRWISYYNPPLQESESERALLYRFNDLLRDVIRRCQVNLPKHRVLLARDVQLCNKTNEDKCALLEEKIRKITAHQIELVGSNIAKRILSNLGTVRQYFIAQNLRLKEQTPLSPAQLQLMQVQHTAAKIELEKRGIEFLTQEKAAIFLDAILSQIKKQIAKAFSSPAVFLEYGLSFRLSDYQPVRVLAKAAKKTGIQINITHVPPKYCTTLCLDKALSQKRSTLVFTLTETSMGTEFSNLTFTLDELGQKFRSKL